MVGQDPIQTFPGDSLTIYTNTEIRFKRIAAGNVPVCDFPGVGGNPGLILDGGLLNPGDDETYPITGLIRVDSQSYFALGNNGGQAPTATGRRFNISAQISGSGNLVFFNGSNRVSQVFSGANDTYSGQWIIKSAWVQASGTNSLGTNSSILVDPLYVLPLDPGIVDVPGPAVLEPMYNVNSAGTLTVNNFGQVRLHQNCAFTAVTIEGQSLSAGTHYYTDLAATFSATTNFPAGGSGAITVQPYGPLPILRPVITTQPLPQMVYAGRTARFTVAASDNGAPPLTYVWRKRGVQLTDGPTGSGSTISGSSTNVLVINNVSAADQDNYDVVVGNPGGSLPSTSAALSVVTPSGEAYEAAVLAGSPAVYYRLNETGDPATSPLAFDYAGGGVGTYGTGTQNGYNNIAGPTPAAGLTGFQAGNTAVQCTRLTPGSRVTVAPWNLNTNSVTITAWIQPNGLQAASEGLVFCRGSGTVAGLNFSPGTDPLGNPTLGYTWNNEWETYSWDSGLVPPGGQWSFVALVVSPTAATIYLMNTNGLLQSTHVYAHVPQSFAGTTTIGDDSQAADGSRTFSGTVDDVAVFTGALSKAQLTTLYAAGLGSAVNYAPSISLQPATQYLYAGQTATFRVAGGGSEPLTYQWKKGTLGSGVYGNVTDGGNISGATTSTLVISNISTADSFDYIVTLSNPYGSTNSSQASLVVYQTFPAENILMAGVLQPGGSDWDTGPSWSDFNAASMSAAMKPGSTYKLTATNGLNTRMRSPQNPRTAIFPGNLLTVDGTGVFTNDFGTNGLYSEIRFKQPNPGTVIFPKLVMNGGQLDAGNDGIIEIGGLIEIRTNTPFYSDSGNDRGFLVSAQLTGTGNIEYRGYNRTTFMSNYVNNLNIAGPNNTFSGKWNVVLGTLLGTAPNCLGTNDIVIGANAAFEPTYDINNTNGSLFLSGRMYLHQNHTFRSLFVNGSPLEPGPYTFAQLNAAYPSNFPAAWMPQAGATNFTTGSGSITVLVQPAPSIVVQPVDVTKYPTETAQFTVTAAGNPPLYYQWRKGKVPLTDGGHLFGSTANTLVITNIVNGDAGSYDVVVTNSIGSVTSSPAILTVLPTGPALNLTLDYGGVPIVQASGLDWNTPTNWSDGNPASLSALANPGSTYRVVAGARLRSPASAAYSAFPGDVLTVEGDGVYANNGTATIGEIRFKHASPGTNYFERLVMNGGQLDSGDNGVMVIQGRMDVLANTPIYTDSAAGQDRPYQIDAWLTGNGSIEFHQFGTTFAGDLNITGTSNTYSGTWNIVQGALLGSGPNSLGTNRITIGALGALETLYDIYNPQGDLILDGQMFLHQNDTFHGVTVAGTPLAPGTYNFEQLNTAYPANFPATWPQQIGSTYTAGSGSITVRGEAPPLPTTPTNIVWSVVGTSLQLQWPPEYTGWLLQEQTNNLAAGISTNKLDWGTVPGSSTTNRVFIPINASRPSEFYKLVFP